MSSTKQANEKAPGPIAGYRPGTIGCTVFSGLSLEHTSPAPSSAIPDNGRGPRAGDAGSRINMLERNTVDLFPVPTIWI